jgi:hypothetical protein
MQRSKDRRYSITSSASASNLSGTLRPSAFAVLRLMTSSNLTARMTGSSAGGVPLRMRPTSQTGLAVFLARKLLTEKQWREVSELMLQCGGCHVRKIEQELKPEAAYFFPQGGERGGLLVVDMTASSQIVEIAERFFFGLNAKVEMMPVMALEDLQQGLSSIEGIVQRYG